MPQVLQTDRTLGILGQLAGEKLREINQNVDSAVIWARIDELDEDILDILAYDLHVDWWKYATTIESKRANLKNAVKIHQIMGTKAACKLAAEMCVGSEVTIREWFEYGGQPGYFRLYVGGNAVLRTLEGLRDLIQLVYIVKRASSWLDEIVVETDLGPSTICMGGAMATIVRMPIPQLPDVLDFETTLHCGGLVAPTITQQLPEIPDAYHFESTLHGGGIMTAESIHSVPELADLSMSHTGRIGGRGSVTTTISVPEIQ